MWGGLQAPWLASDDKTYHFTFCFKATGAIDGNLVTIGTMQVGADCRESIRRRGQQVRDRPCPTPTTCLYIDAPGFSESSTDQVVLFFSYKILGSERFKGCATGHVVGDVCGKTGQSPLKDNPRGMAARRRRRRRRHRPVHAESGRLQRDHSLRPEPLTISRRSERFDEERDARA